MSEDTMPKTVAEQALGEALEGATLGRKLAIRRAVREATLFKPPETTSPKMPQVGETWYHLEVECYTFADSGKAIGYKVQGRAAKITKITDKMVCFQVCPIPSVPMINDGMGSMKQFYTQIFPHQYSPTLSEAKSKAVAESERHVAEAERCADNLRNALATMKDWQPPVVEDEPKD